MPSISGSMMTCVAPWPGGGAAANTAWAVVLMASSNDTTGGGDGGGATDVTETAGAAAAAAGAAAALLGAARGVESSTRVCGTQPVLSAPSASKVLLTSLLDIGPVFIIKRLS